MSKDAELFLILNPMSQNLIFLHIPKAAGTSFRRIMQTTLGKEHVAWREGKRELEDIQKLIKDGKNLRVIGGHFSYQKAKEYFPGDYTYFATLREPLERAISLYQYISRTKSHHLYEDLQGKTMLEAINDVKAFRGQVSNLQCNYLSDSSERSFKAAVASILINGIKVNTLDYPQVLLREAAHRLELKKVPQEMRANTSKGKSNYSKMLEDEELLERLTELNKHDIHLYKRVTKLFSQQKKPSYKCLGRLIPPHMVNPSNKQYNS